MKGATAHSAVPWPIFVPARLTVHTHTRTLTRKLILKSAPSSVARSTPGDPTACGQNGGATSGGSAGPVLRHPEG